MISAMYIHIPFCKSICSYCDFTKLFYNTNYEETYLNKLFEEIESDHPCRCKTIYIGGGTPTSLSAYGLDRLLKFLKQYLLDDYEFTIEVNPETIDEEKIRILSDYGVNRVSIGVQSFDENVLKLLNRRHSYQDVKKCVDLLNQYGIDNYSFDFIYGINGQSLMSIDRDFSYIDAFKPKHLSFYSLILEEHTSLKINHYEELNEDQVVEQYEYIYQELLKRGYIQYEVSNYCLPGYESKHNLTYWEDKEYYGFGLGASGYVTGTRYTNTKSLNKYLEGNNYRSVELVNKDEQKEEYIMLGLRLNKGLDLKEYSLRFNENLLEIKKNEIDKLINDNLIKISGNRLFTTHQGMLLLDMVTLKLI